MIIDRTCALCSARVQFRIDLMPRTILCDNCAMSPERLVGEAMLIAVVQGSPGRGARLLVDAGDPRRLDDGLEALLADTAGITSTDRCLRDEDQTQPHATCDTLPPPDGCGP